MKRSKLLKCSLTVKTAKILVNGLHKIAIFRKDSSLAYLDYSLSKGWIFGIIDQSFQKDSSVNKICKHFKK